MKMFKRILIISLLLMIWVMSVGCDINTEANYATQSAKEDAENFKVPRRFLLINTKKEVVEAEIVGAFSREESSFESVTLTIKTDNDKYIRHIVKLNKDSIYIIEDLSEFDIGKYQYFINYYPDKISSYK